MWELHHSLSVVCVLLVTLAWFLPFSVLLLFLLGAGSLLAFYHQRLNPAQIPWEAFFNNFNTMYRENPGGIGRASPHPSRPSVRSPFAFVSLLREDEEVHPRPLISSPPSPAIRLGNRGMNHHLPDACIPSSTPSPLLRGRYSPSPLSSSSLFNSSHVRSTIDYVSPKGDLGNSSLSVGTFPWITSPRERVSERVKIKIAPPQVNFLSVTQSPMDESTNLDTSVTSVVRVLSEKSRKRLHVSTEEDDKDPGPKRHKVSEHNHNLYESKLENSDEITVHDESSICKSNSENITCPEKKIKLTTLSKTNEIISSLSSSVGITPPHLLVKKHHRRDKTKRKSKGTPVKSMTDKATETDIPDKGESKAKKQKPDSEQLPKKMDVGLQTIEKGIDKYFPPPSPPEPVKEKEVTQPMASALLKSAMSKFMASGVIGKDAKPSPTESEVKTSAVDTTPVKVSEPSKPEGAGPSLSFGPLTDSPISVTAPASTPSFTFGANTTTTKPSETPPTTKPPEFSFGTKPQTEPETKKTPKKTVTFNFGNITPNDVPKANPPSGTPVTTENAIKPTGFTFGAQPTTTLPSSAPPTTKLETPKLQQNEAKPASQPFTFGSSNLTPQSTTASSVAPATTPSTPVTASTAPSSTANQIFSFGNPSSTPSTLFGTPTSTSKPASMGGGAITKLSLGQPSPKSSLGGFNPSSPLPSLFGAPQNKVSQPGASASTPAGFSMSSPKPTNAPTFGTPATTDQSIFGSVGGLGTTSFAATTANSTSTNSLFGSTPSSQAVSSPTFGTPTSSTSTQKVSGFLSGVFGTPTTQPSAFGTPTTTQPSLFNATTKAVTTSTFTFGAGSSSGDSKPAFGAATPSSAFGAAKPAASVFGTSSTGTPSFGANATAPAFGGTTNAPAFGGTTTASAFGGTTPGFGGVTTTAFGGTTTASAFGASPATPTFGSSTFGSNPAPSFGAKSPTPAFGAPGSTPSFGVTSQQQNTTTGFGTPATTQSSLFGTSQPTTAFASQSGSQPSIFSTPTTTSQSTFAFGSTSTAPQASSAFSATQSKPAFGASTFGSTQTFGSQQAAPTFGSSTAFGGQANASSTFTFGKSQGQGDATPSFGSTQPTQNAFGGASTSAFKPQTTPVTNFTAGPTQPSQQPFTFGAQGSAFNTPSTSFGQPSDPSKPFTFGANQTTPKPGGFAFGAAAGPSQPAQPFQFNATAVGGGQPMFSIGSGSTAPRIKSHRQKKK